MIHSARPIVSPVATIIFYCFVLLDLKSGDGRERTVHPSQKQENALQR